MSAFARVAIVVTLVALDLGFVLPDSVRPFYQLGYSGINNSISAPNIVRDVVADSSAAKAHIEAGDAVSLPSMFDRIRWIITGADISLHPGMSENLVVTHGTQSRNVTILTGPYNGYPAWMAAVRVFVETFWILLAAFLLLRRPNVTTWSFFLFSIFPGIAPEDIALLTYPQPLIPIYFVVLSVFTVISGSAGMVFILSLGGLPIPRWHWNAAYVLIPVLVMLALPYTIFSMVWVFAGETHSIFAFGGAAAYALSSAAFTAIVFLALLGAIYSENRGMKRQQLIWVTAGFAIYELALIAAALLPPATPFAVNAILYILEGLLPLCVTYAVLKHRLIDINFFVSRTLVYAILSGGVIATFGLVDWLFSKELDNQRLGTVAEVGVAIALGFWFNNIHRRIDYFVDSVFFRRKHLAEKHLQHLARALQHAPSEVSISKGLIDEPVSALELSSAALFKRSGDLTYRRVYARGWSDDAVADLHDDDTILLRMQVDRDAVVLDDVIIGAQNLPRGSAKPDIALPIHVRNDLVAVVFYGGHTHGEHLDGDEIRAISALVFGAAAGYSNIQSRSLREKAECALAQAELAKQEARLATLETDVLRAELEAWRKTVRNDER